MITKIYLIGIIVSIIFNIIHFCIRYYYDKLYFKTHPGLIILIPLIYTTLLFGVLSWIGAILLILGTIYMIRQ